MHVCAKQQTSDRSWRSQGHPPHAISGRLGGAVREITGKRRGGGLISRNLHDAWVQLVEIIIPVGRKFSKASTVKAATW
jgi:hypothetical protein